MVKGESHKTIYVMVNGLMTLVVSECVVIFCFTC